MQSFPKSGPVSSTTQPSPLDAARDCVSSQNGSAPQTRPEDEALTRQPASRPRTRALGIQSLLLLISLGLATLMPSVASAKDDLGVSVEVGWRVTQRNAYVFYGDSSEQFDLPDLIANNQVSSGLNNAATELGRFELQIEKSVTPELRGFVRYAGGRFRLQLASTLPEGVGLDHSFDFGGKLKSFEKGRFSLYTHVAGRARTWSFADDVISKHGNLGILIAVQPTYGPCSLLIENTLSALWLYDLSDLGAQKDSSILRIRPECRYERGAFVGYVATEYYHTHTEFFGTTAIPGQDAWMLDDFDLALVVGGGVKF